MRVVVASAGPAERVDNKGGRMGSDILGHRLESECRRWLDNGCSTSLDIGTSSGRSGPGRGRRYGDGDVASGMIVVG